MTARKPTAGHPFSGGLLGILCSLLLLLGCVSLPKDQQTQNLIPSPSIETSVSKSLGSNYFTEGPWPKENWWEIFDSPELNGLIVDALSSSPTISSIQRRVEAAKQMANVVRSKLFPLLFFEANETWEILSKNGLYRALNPDIPLNANLIDLTLSFQYEFDFWGKNRNLFLAALGQKKAEEAEAAEVQLITTTAVAQAYFALKTNLVRKKLYEKLLEVRRETYALQTLLQEKALLSMLPPLLSKENLLEAKQHVAGIQEEVETGQHLINILIGRGPDIPLNIQDLLPPVLQSLILPSNLSLDLLSRRPDLMAQIWRVEALAHEVGAARADFYPDINLTAFTGLESVLYRNLLHSGSKTAGLQPAIHLPLFTAGAIRANIRAKKAAFDGAVFEYNHMLLKSVQEVADLLAIGRTAFEQKEEQQQILDAALARYALVDLRMRSGLDHQLTRLFVEEELIQKQLFNVTLIYNQYLAAIRLIRALGGGYQSEYSIPLKNGRERG